jgi:hypothetical protein
MQSNPGSIVNSEPPRLGVLKRPLRSCSTCCVARNSCSGSGSGTGSRNGRLSTLRGTVLSRLSFKVDLSGFNYIRVGRIRFL